MITASTVMTTLESMGVEEYTLLKGVDGSLVLVVHEEDEDKGRTFYAVDEAEAEDQTMVLRLY